MPQERNEQLALKILMVPPKASQRRWFNFKDDKSDENGKHQAKIRVKYY